MTGTKKFSETKEAEEAEEAPEDGVLGPDVKPSEIDAVSNSVFGLHPFPMSNAC